MLTIHHSARARLRCGCSDVRNEQPMIQNLPVRTPQHSRPPSSNFPTLRESVSRTECSVISRPHQTPVAPFQCTPALQSHRLFFFVQCTQAPKSPLSLAIAPFSGCWKKWTRCQLCQLLPTRQRAWQAGRPLCGSAGALPARLRGCIPHQCR